MPNPGVFELVRPKPTATPKYTKGAQIGKLTVIRYIGFSVDRPNGKRLQTPQHWYEVRCECGTVETVNQGQIRKREYCINCAGSVPSKQAPRDNKPAEPLPAHLDFARLKF